MFGSSALSGTKIHQVDILSVGLGIRNMKYFDSLVTSCIIVHMKEQCIGKAGRMERLWAPWRMKYISSVDDKTDSCIFCEKPKSDKDRDNLILFRGETAFVIMNLYPYNNGHLMVVPYTHCSSLDQLKPDEIAEIWDLVRTSTTVLKDAIHPDGFNIGMNVGRVAGAGIDQHLHMHVVPRWNGDANFMPVIGDTKVISQGIEETYDTLHRGFSQSGT